MWCVRECIRGCYRTRRVSHLLNDGLVQRHTVHETLCFHLFHHFRRKFHLNGHAHIVDKATRRDVPIRLVDIANI